MQHRMKFPGLTTLHRRQQQGGFTMLELMVAISILVIMVGIIYASFASVTDSMILAQDSAERLRYKQYLQEHFSQHFPAVYTDSACIRPEYQFLGEEDSSQLGPADYVRFCTSLPLSGPYALPGMRKVVHYTVGDAGELGGDWLPGYDEGDSQLYLRIYEEPLIITTEQLDLTGAEAPESLIVERFIPIHTFKLSYYDGLDDTWYEEWDSLEEGRLPWAVRIQVGLPRTEAQLNADWQRGLNPVDHPDLDMTFMLPGGAGIVGPFEDMNHHIDHFLDMENGGTPGAS